MVTLAERLRAVLEITRHTSAHDTRAAGTFLRRMYPKESWLSGGVQFLGWMVRQCSQSIPLGLRGTTFARPVSRKPIWLEDANPLAGRSQQLPQRVDVAVIGAGFTGASLAYHWAKSGTGQSMVVLEMGEAASGSSGRNAGEVVMGRYFALVYSTVRKHLPLALPPADLDQLAAQFAAVYCRAAYRNADMVERTIREEGFQCDYAREGWVQERGAEEQSTLEETVRVGRENGFEDWDKLTAMEASNKTGARIEWPTNFSRRAARFHPAKWTWSLFQRALASASVQLHQHTKVLAVQDEGEYYRVSTQRGTILARHLVYATEAYTAKLNPRFRGIVNPRQSQAAYGVDEGHSLKPNVPFSGSTFFSLRHRTGILFGSDETPIPPEKAGQNRPSRFISLFVLGQLRERFGGFSLHVTNEWAGSVGFTPDEYPIVGLADGKRQYIIAGMSGSGTAVSFNAGRCICGRILGGIQDDDYPPEYFSPARLLDPVGHTWPSVNRTSERPCVKAE